MQMKGGGAGVCYLTTVREGARRTLKRMVKDDRKRMPSTKATCCLTNALCRGELSFYDISSKEISR